MEVPSESQGHFFLLPHVAIFCGPEAVDSDKSEYLHAVCTPTLEVSLVVVSNQSQDRSFFIASVLLPVAVRQVRRTNQYILVCCVYSQSSMCLQ